MYKNISVEDETIQLSQQHQTQNYRLELNSQTAAEQYLLNIHHHLPIIGIHALLLNSQQQLIDTQNLLQETFSISDLTATTITHYCKHKKSHPSHTRLHPPNATPHTTRLRNPANQPPKTNPPQPQHLAG